MRSERKVKRGKKNHLMNIIFCSEILRFLWLYEMFLATDWKITIGISDIERFKMHIKHMIFALCWGIDKGGILLKKRTQIYQKECSTSLEFIRYQSHISMIMPHDIFSYDDVIKWKHFPCNWPIVRWIHRPPVNSLHKCQWRGALMFSLICVSEQTVNNCQAGDLRHHRTIMTSL